MSFKFPPFSVYRLEFTLYIVFLCLWVSAPTLDAQQSELARPKARVSIEDETKIQKIDPTDTPFPIPRIRVDIDPQKERGQIGTTLQILFLLTILSLSPSILIMATSFTRILIVLNFVRRALTTQQEPSNQILIGLALFLTFYTMAPVLNEINEKAIKPFVAKNIDYVEAYNIGIKPVREFMFAHTRKTDLALFAGMENSGKPQTKETFSTLALIPAFMTSEIRTAFQMGVIIFLPFLIIDMVVASILMSMGMIMLPPVMISLPFKILLFVLVDGWNLVIRSLVLSFGGNG